jgi:hypothetical protein
VWPVARYDEVHQVLKDWQTFCSGRDAGLTDFAKEKAWRPKSLLLETDPPLHDRTRRVLNPVPSASVMTRLRQRFAQEADKLIESLVDRGSFDAIADLAEAYPLTVFPDAMGMPRENRRFLLPYGNMVFNSFGPRNQFFEEAVNRLFGDDYQNIDYQFWMIFLDGGEKSITGRGARARPPRARLGVKAPTAEAPGRHLPSPKAGLKQRADLFGATTL